MTIHITRMNVNNKYTLSIDQKIENLLQIHTIVSNGMCAEVTKYVWKFVSYNLSVSSVFTLFM